MPTRKQKKPLIIGNWKMYISAPSEVAKFSKIFLTKFVKTAGSVKANIWLAPPVILLPTAKHLFGRTLTLGAQSVSVSTEGPHTGEVSARMLKHAGAKFVIVGHSERRAAGESDEAVNLQVINGQAEGLTVVLCVGETFRDEHGSYFETVALQLISALTGFPKTKAASCLVVAYEPVWAIGKSASDALHPSDVEAMQIFIRKVLTEVLGRTTASEVPILYGGSVKPENARALMSESGVQGFLVGSASTNVESFLSVLVHSSSRVSSK